jgi:hypothetical protein
MNKRVFKVLNKFDKFVFIKRKREVKKRWNREDAVRSKLQVKIFAIAS